MGLLAAINRFDPKKGNKFSTYATWWIKQHIARYKDTIYSEVRVPIHYMERVNQLNKILREDFINPTTDELPLSYLKNVSERSEINIEDLNKILEKSLWKRDFQFDIDPLLYDSEDESSETKIFVNFLMENTALKEKEREIIEKRFGINLSQSMTLEEIGQEFDVTRERIRQIESKAIKKLCVKYKSIVGLETLTQSSNL